jgi:YD repeat-containing protein
MGKRYVRTVSSLTAALIVTFAALSARAVVLRVDSDVVVAGDGSSWGGAFSSVQAALQVSATNDEIWVAGGTYTPGVVRTDSFILKPGVAVYGGFSGAEQTRGSRDIGANLTLLSGDIGVVDDRSDNCYHVVTGADGARLDGFTIAGGNADGDAAPHMFGAGIYNSQSSPTIANCTFSSNWAIPYGSGGAVYNDNASPTIADCTFSANRAYWGGGICNVSDSAPVVEDCRFVDNVADYGGGICNRRSSPTIRRSIFIRNSGDGGSLSNRESSPTVEGCVFADGNGGAWDGGGLLNVASSPTVTNCLLVNNTVSKGQGGGAYNWNSAPLFTNCTLYGNQSVIADGGGIFTHNAQGMLFRNCLLWGNVAGTVGGEASIYGAAPAFSHCDVESSLSGAKVAGTPPLDEGGNIAVDPEFADPAVPTGADGVYRSADDGLQLGLNSPCIDAGTSAEAPQKDLAELTRPRGYGIDIGAYEYDTDYDDDGLTNNLETELGSNLYNSDSDADTVTDYDEYVVNGSNLMAADTDSDGMPDSWEIAHGLNPFIDDSQDDADLDWLTNIDEFTLGLNPRDTDTDSDGVPDFRQANGQSGARYLYDPADRLVGAEYELGLSIGYAYDGNDNIIRQVYLQRDSDDDQLPDLWEFLNGLAYDSAQGVAGFAGDPDRDRWTNFQEWQAGSNPLSNEDTPESGLPGSKVVRQTAPIARILSFAANAAAEVSVQLRFWDAEGNLVSPELQYLDEIAGLWRDATIKGTSTLMALEALPNGSTHTVTWHAHRDLSPSFLGLLQLRCRARDVSATGPWSPVVSGVRVDMRTDADADTLPDWWEAVHFDGVAQAPDGDYDGDGDSNATEYSAGTDPASATSVATGGEVYSNFHFEIYRGAVQTGDGILTESFWGAKLDCASPTGQVFATGTLTKPVHTQGTQEVELTIADNGMRASFERSDYTSRTELMEDFVAGEYRVELTTGDGRQDTDFLRLILAVPDYSDDDFPPFVKVNSPTAGSDDAATRPLLKFDTEKWEHLEIHHTNADALVYSFTRGTGDPRVTEHQVSGTTPPLAGETLHALIVDVNEWGTTWLGSMSQLDFTPDSVGPIVVITRVPDLPYYNGGAYVLSISGGDAVSLDYSLDQSLYVPYADPLTISGEGAHQLDAKAVDAAGNEGIGGPVVFTLDRVPPAVNIILFPSSREPSSAYTVTVDGGDGLVVEYSLDGAAFVSYTTPVTVTSAGWHWFSARSTDAAGNIGMTGPDTFFVTKPPASWTQDSDGDGMPDLWEEHYGLNASIAQDRDLDIDLDGLTNGEELARHTNPNDGDTDGDGMSDGWEVDNNFDPLDSADAVTDADGDESSNVTEFDEATDPWARQLKVGWNLISFVSSVPTPASDERIMDVIWYWDADGERYGAVPEDADLHPWLGYWFYVTSSCQINLQTGVVSE